MSYTKSLNINQDETIILEARKHWFVFILEIIPLVIASILPVIILVIILTVFHLSLSNHYLSLIMGFYLLWLLIMWTAIFAQWTIYYLNIWILTDRRIFDVNQKSLFHQSVSILRLEQLQDINISINGIFASLIGYGNLEVESAGAEIDQFLITGVKDPYLIKEIISKACDAVMEQEHHFRFPEHSGLQS
ncbi:MAG: hypothetical protein WCO03_01870 [bacterium]